MAILNDVHFRNGEIDVDVAGAPAKGANESARGFIGVAFRVQSESRFEIIYLRPTNSHADDQLRRNHTAQYSAEPDWPWDRLRKESPGVYESWVDMQTAEWTHMRIVVHGTDASLYVNHAANPCLIIHDLKLGDIEGLVRSVDGTGHGWVLPQPEDLQTVGQPASHPSHLPFIQLSQSRIYSD